MLINFIKVKITKKTAYYKVIMGHDEAHNKYKKMGYLKPGQIVYVRGRGVVWGWTIGKKYNYCSFRNSYDYSWFTTNLKTKKRAKTRSTKSNNKATFTHKNGTYTYNDKYCTISFNGDAQYHNAKPGNPANVTLNLRFKNKTKNTVAAEKYIQQRIKVSQSADYLNFKVNHKRDIKHLGWVDMVGHNKYETVPMIITDDINPEDNFVLIFSAPHASKESGVAIFSPLADEKDQHTTSPANTVKVNPNATVPTVSSNTIPEFTFPASANSMVAKANIIFSLQGNERKAADLALMKEMGMVTNGRPDVSFERFETQLRSITNGFNQAANWIINGQR